MSTTPAGRTGLAPAQVRLHAAAWSQTVAGGSMVSTVGGGVARLLCAAPRPCRLTTTQLQCSAGELQPARSQAAAAPPGCWKETRGGFSRLKEAGSWAASSAARPPARSRPPMRLGHGRGGTTRQQRAAATPTRFGIYKGRCRQRPWAVRRGSPSAGCPAARAHRRDSTKRGSARRRTGGFVTRVGSINKRKPGGHRLLRAGPPG